MLSAADNSIRQWLSLFLIYEEETQDQRGEGTNSGLHSWEWWSSHRFSSHSILGSPGQQTGGHSASEKCREYSPLSSSSRAAAELECAGDYVKVGEIGWGLATV